MAAQEQQLAALRSEYDVLRNRAGELAVSAEEVEAPRQPDADHYMARARVFAKKEDNLEAALVEYTRAVELDPSEAAAIDDALFTAGLYAGRAPMAALWPTYTPDAFYFALADTDASILMMQGTLDPQTPPAVATNLRDLFTGPRQTYVLIPYAAHNAVQQSPKSTGGTCGGALMQQFLSDPSAALDTVCTVETYAPSLDPAPATVQAVFGTTDLWD